MTPLLTVLPNPFQPLPFIRKKFTVNVSGESSWSRTACRYSSVCLKTCVCRLCSLNYGEMFLPSHSAYDACNRSQQTVGVCEHVVMVNWIIKVCHHWNAVKQRAKVDMVTMQLSRSGADTEAETDEVVEKFGDKRQKTNCGKLKVPYFSPFLSASLREAASGLRSLLERRLWFAWGLRK